MVMASICDTEIHEPEGVINKLSFSRIRIEGIESIGELVSLFMVAKLYHDKGYALLDE